MEDETEPEVTANLVHYTIVNGKYSEQYGLKDEAGNVAVKAKYDFYGCSNKGMAYLKNNSNANSEGAYMIGYVNSFGEPVIPLDIAAGYGWFLDARDFSEGLVTVSKKDEWSYMDEEGNTVIAFKYETDSDFSGSLATVLKDYKYRAINHSGDSAIILKYSHLGEFKESLMVFPPVSSDETVLILNVK